MSVLTPLKTYPASHLSRSLTTPYFSSLLYITPITALVHIFAFSALQSVFHTNCKDLSLSYLIIHQCFTIVLRVNPDFSAYNGRFPSSSHPFSASCWFFLRVLILKAQLSVLEILLFSLHAYYLDNIMQSQLSSKCHINEDAPKFTSSPDLSA